jgi:hypothetical protein
MGLQVKDELLGRRIKCPNCDNRFPAIIEVWTREARGTLWAFASWAVLFGLLHAAVYAYMWTSAVHSEKSVKDRPVKPFLKSGGITFLDIPNDDEIDRYSRAKAAEEGQLYFIGGLLLSAYLCLLGFGARESPVSMSVLSLLALGGLAAVFLFLPGGKSFSISFAIAYAVLIGTNVLLLIVGVVRGRVWVTLAKR